MLRRKWKGGREDEGYARGRMKIVGSLKGKKGLEREEEGRRNGGKQEKWRKMERGRGRRRREQGKKREGEG